MESSGGQGTSALIDDHVLVACDHQGFVWIRAARLFVTRPPEKLDNNLLSIDLEGDWCHKSYFMCMIVTCVELFETFNDQGGTKPARDTFLMPTDR